MSYKINIFNKLSLMDIIEKNALCYFFRTTQVQIVNIILILGGI